jgi:hypothetical protein
MKIFPKLCYLSIIGFKFIGCSRYDNYNCFVCYKKFLRLCSEANDLSPTLKLILNFGIDFKFALHNRIILMSVLSKYLDSAHS